MNNDSKLKVLAAMFDKFVDERLAENGKQSDRAVPSIAAFDAEQLELDTLVQLSDAEEQAKNYAARRNAGKTRSAQGDDDEIKKGVLSWIKRTNRSRRNH